MLELRPITNEETDAFRDCMMASFGGDLQDDPGGSERIRTMMTPGRAFAVFDEGRVVATMGAFTSTLVVPGGTVPMAGLTMGAVRSTHRRRGLMRDLMLTQLDDARRRGEPIAGLWTSDAAIYGRFGYGVATEGDTIEVDTRGLTIPDRGEPKDGDAVVQIDEATARALLPGLYARVCADRPGTLLRDEVWWRERRMLESGFARAGASRRRYVIVNRGAAMVGYVAFRQRPGFVNGALSGTVELTELIALDAAAEASLWRYIFSIDLFPAVKWTNAPTDSPLPWLVSDSRRVTRRRTDALWLRIGDVPAALAARRYACDGALRFAIGETTWQLEVEQGRGACTQVDADPELRCTLPALGSAFLGGVSIAVLARARQITGPQDAVMRANRLFAWPVAPWCPETF